MLTRYKGSLKLKDWAFAIAKRSTMQGADRARPSSRHHHARHAATRHRVQTGVAEQLAGQEVEPSSERSDARGREQMTAPIV